MSMGLACQHQGQIARSSCEKRLYLRFTDVSRDMGLPGRGALPLGVGGVVRLPALCSARRPLSGHHAGG